MRNQITESSTTSLDNPGGSNAIRVLIVEDSPTAALLLKTILEADPQVEVVGLAHNGLKAVNQTLALRPDVLIMDANMPVMDGFEATRQIMEQAARPIVMVSASLDPKAASILFKALEAGAVAIVQKPVGPNSSQFAQQAAELLTTVKLMADLKVVTRIRRENRISGPVINRGLKPVRPIEIVAIAASTGGPAALATILRELPVDLPVPIVVVQHITSGFDQGLVAWLNQLTPLSVQLAEDRQRLRAGQILVAPSDKHLGVRLGAVKLTPSVSISGFRPSATHLFQTVADVYGARGLGIILTGMGNDGAEGLLALRQASGRVLAQDEASCVVYGMPAAAVKLGAVDQIVPLNDISSLTSTLCQEGRD